MMNIKKLITVLSLMTIIATPTLLLAETGLSGGISLLQPVSAKATAMGEAYVASTNDVFGFSYNPAQDIHDRQFSAHFHQGLLDDSFSAFGMAVPLSFGSLGVNILHYDGGPIDLLTTAGDERNVKAQSDIIGIVSLNRKMDKVILGGSLKYLSSKLIEEYSDTLFMFDVGAKYLYSEQLQFGAALQNLGGQIKYLDEQDQLPSLFRIGAVYRHKALTAELDAIKIYDESHIKKNIGLSYGLTEVFTLLAGYKFGYDSEDLSLGLGFTQEWFSFNYAFVPFADLGDLHTITLGVKF